ncbi:MAG TPA: hypothetical protein VKG44_04970, partial [Candidatus Baltobacteraceae bacterium]|nr:hypothetical protein [Candidatus Baltobacteraceae bacterium]
MLKRFSVSFLLLLLAVVLSASAASASGKIILRYRVFPSGKDLLPASSVGSPLKTTALKHLGKHEFIFWDVTGRLPQTTQKLADFAPSGTTFA